MFRISFLRAGLTTLAALALLAVSSPVAQAQTIARGGTLRCISATLLPEVSVVTAQLVWNEGGTPVGTTQSLTCNTTTEPTVSGTIMQPSNATGWTLTISMTHATFGTFTCVPDTGTFTAGEFPRIRFRCESPTGGAATFSLSRKP